MKTQLTFYKLFAIIFLALFIVSCNVKHDKNIAQKEIRDDLVGYWYGKLTLDDGTIHHWIANHQADGRLNLEFKGVKDTIIVYRSSEQGFWVANESQFTSMIKIRYHEDGIRNEVDEQYPYTIVDVKPEKIVYTNPDYEFEAERVESDFTL